MADTLTGLLTAVGEAFLKERNLVGRNFKRGVSVLEKNILEMSTQDALKLVFGSKGHKEKNSGNLGQLC